MATVIHHGGGVGTYKSFAVVQRHAIPQLQTGRVVISTIRGFDSIRVIEAVLGLEIPDESEIIFVDIETTKGLNKIRRWWEWAPKGAYIIIDEAQKVYPKSKKIDKYDYIPRDGMTSEETAEKDNLPDGFITAFTMQRHYNWDLAIICPNIKMLVPEIKEVTQTAYEHRRMSDLVPWRKHGWREKQHSPNETAKSSIFDPIQYNADTRIYQVYKSTKTGEHTNSGAERSIFTNPKVIFALSTIVLSIGLLIYLLLFHVFGQGSSSAVEKSNEIVVKSSDIASTNYVDNSVKHSVSNDGDDVLEPGPEYIETTTFDSPRMAIVGRMFKDYIIEIGVGKEAYQLTTGQLYRNGVEVEIINNCKISLKHADQNYMVRCPLHRRSFAESKKIKSVTFNPLVNQAGK